MKYVNSRDKEGGIQQLRGQNFAIFGPPPLAWTVLHPEHFYPSPPHLFHAVIEWPLSIKYACLSTNFIGI